MQAIGSTIKEHRVFNHRKLALLAGTAALALAPAGVAQADTKQSSKECKQNPKKCPVSKTGRMTGHGQNNVAGVGKVQWEFRNSVCNANRFPDLKVEFGAGQRFILKSYSAPLRCVDTAASEGRPVAGFDTIIGQGAGTLNGKSGYTITFRFTDSGEPGREDLATFTIMDPDGDPVISVTNLKAGTGGNHQAHRK